jgi:hypothetical protein
MSAIHTSRQVTSHSTTPGHHSSSADWLKVETVHTSKYRTMGKRRSPLRLFFSNTNHNNENSKQYKTKTMKKKNEKENNGKIIHVGGGPITPERQYFYQNRDFDSVDKMSCMA